MAALAAVAVGRLPRRGTARTLDFDRITLTDTATVVNVDVYYTPGSWIALEKTAYMSGDGKKYMITGADGIVLGARHDIPESGRDSFVLYFEPIDPALETVDFIEGDESYHTWKILGIDLRGGKSVKAISAQTSAAVPREVRSADYSAGPLPEPELKNGMSSLRVVIPGYRPELKFSPSLTVLSVIPHPKDSYQPTEIAEGEWLFDFPLFGPTAAILDIGEGMTMNIVLEPGAAGNVWIDLAAWSNMVAPEDERTTWAWFDGRYAAFNTVWVNEASKLNVQYGLSLDDDMLRAMKDMPGENIIPTFKARRDERLADVESSGLSPAVREALAYQIRSSYLVNIGQLASRIAYRRLMDDESLVRDNATLQSLMPFFTPDDYRAAYAGTDFNDPRMLYGIAAYAMYGPLASSDVRKVSGIDGTLAGDYLAVRRKLNTTFADKAAEADANAAFAAITNPFFAEALALRTEYMEKRKAAAKGVNVREAPADLDVFDKIIANYKGSPVLVDFWATWCGPCINAMKQQHAIKEELLEQGVVFVYITGETSPRATWEISIPDIKGEHYYLTDAQWKELYRKFNVDGIPFYIMVQRDGTYKADTSMRSLGVWESTIRAALEKK